MKKNIKLMDTNFISTYLSKNLAPPPYNIIIANGLFPKKITFLLEHKNFIVCCDGAIIKLLRKNVLPDFIIGDCDSIPIKILNSLSDKVIKIDDQNTNDLTKAVVFCKNKLYLDTLIILGATGLREDHTIANIFLLYEYFKLVKNVVLISDFGIFTVHLGKFKLETVIGQQISFYSPYCKVNISCNNLKWPLNNFLLNTMYQATLNEALDSFIEGEAKEPIIIFRSFELKF